MRDIFNPVILLVVVLMLATRVTSADGDMAQTLDLLMLTLCTVCCIMSFALAVARMLVRRRALMPVVWSVVYLIVGCCVWSISFRQPEQGEIRQVFYDLHTQYQAGANPCIRSEEGDSLPALAATLGETRVLEDILNTHGDAVPMDVKVEAAHSAAAAGKVGALSILLNAGVDVNACVEGVSLLNAAAENGMSDAMLELLKRGADVHMADDEGATPLMNAVMTDRPTPVRLLLKYGADATRRDKNGRDAASYARSEEMATLLNEAAH